VGATRLMLFLILFNIAISVGSSTFNPQDAKTRTSAASAIHNFSATLDASLLNRPCKPIRHSWYPCFDPCHSGSCHYAHCVSLFAFENEDADSSANKEILIIRNTKRIDPDLSLEKHPPKKS